MNGSVVGDDNVVLSEEFAAGLVNQKRYDEAEIAYRKLINKNKLDLGLVKKLARVCLFKGDVQNAAQCYQKIIESNSSDGAAWSGLGVCLQIQGDCKDAIVCYEKAQSFGYNQQHQMYSNWAKALGLIGDFEASESMLIKAYKMGAGPQILSIVADMKKQSVEDKWLLSELLGVLEQEKLNQNDKASVLFALAKYYSDIGAHKDAFNCCDQANKIRYSNLHSNIAIIKYSVETQIKHIDKTFIERVGSSSEKSTLPIFVLGCMRSGTTLVEQMLSRHAQVYGAGELCFMDDILLGARVTHNGQSISYPDNLPFIKYEHLQTLSDAYLSQMQRFDIGSATRIVDKLPGNFMHLGLISLMFPNSAILHCKRHPLDTCLSIYFQDFTHAKSYQCSLHELAEFYKLYTKLMEHWQELLPICIHEIYYEELLSRPEEVSRNVLGYCKLDFQDITLVNNGSDRAIYTASNWQVKQQLYHHSINKWKHYSAFTDVMKPLLKDEIEQYHEKLKALGLDS
mgnify:CR=1 FL=1